MPKAFTPNDKYFYKAKKLWYRARSAFKLIEINEKFSIFRKWQNVLDLGACPWSWCQVVKEYVWKESKIVWVDLKEMKKIKWVSRYICDIFSPKLWEILAEREKLVHFDVILSDIAPNTSGITDVDQYRSVELNLEVLEVMKKHLKTWWVWVFKVFRWEDFNDFWFQARKIFPEMKTFKPRAVRDRSVEIYCIWKKR